MENINNENPAADRRFWWFVLAFFGAWTLRVVLLMPVDDRIEDPVWQFVWGQGLRYALWVAPVIAYIRVDKSHVLPFLRLDTLPRGKRLLAAVLVIVAYLATAGIEGALFKGEHPERWITLGSLPVLWRIFMAAWAPVAEEILFRGFIQRHLEASHPFWRANAVQATLFVAIHWPGWLYMRGFHTALFLDSAGILLIGLILGWLCRHTASLWPSIALHALNNAWRGLCGN